MNRGKISILLTLLFTVAALNSYGKQNATPKPNVLFIMVDDLRPALGCYGDALARTPHMDALAGTGTLFSRAYCQQAVCSPSRTSMLTGLRPDATQVWGLKRAFRETTPGAVTLPQHFKNNGYITAQVGKIFHDPASHQDNASWSGPVLYNVTGNGKGHKYILDTNLKGGKGASTERQAVPDSSYIDGKVADASVQVLRQIADKPFFLAIGFRRPHLPFTAPDKYWKPFDKTHFPFTKPERPNNAPAIAFHNSQELRGYSDIPQEGTISEQLARHLWQGYYAAVSYTDAQIGKVLAELDRLKLRQNTIIVLVSDHGFHLGEQDQWAKSTNFENAVRVPLIIAAPGVSKPAKSNAVVELLDVYPTLSELCGLPVRKELQGKSLLTILKNPAASFKGFALSQFIRPYPALQDESKIRTMGYTLRTDRYRYTEWYTFKTDSIIARELYDHRNDPAETDNIEARTPKALLDSLHKRLTELTAAR
ncbi:iduronate 2-sulfatase [Dyadobacter sp. SG02]|uniref:sulfatase n=1 Tax=Dyadobacter sp. SG02 TaxID=1855291 RepID=UPI0008D52C04|nr:sulfatase [Dyadobacter sp. SG02]SEI57361.1 iduronate 2-sulfatase [Dyadobacter sp. SG02]